MSSGKSGVEVRIVRNRLSRISVELPRAALAAVEEITRTAHEEVVKNTPVLSSARPDRKPGELRDSVQMEVTAEHGRVWTDIYWAHMEERGSIHNPPHWMFRKGEQRAGELAAKIAKTVVTELAR